MSENDETIEFEGEVAEALRGRMLRIHLDNGHETLGLSRVERAGAETGGKVGREEAAEALETGPSPF